MIAKAVEYAKGNALNSGITASDIATNAGFSIDYFNKLKELGIHPGEHVNEYINIISERLDGVYEKKLQNK